jgi:hypothetical protein
MHCANEWKSPVAENEDMKKRGEELERVEVDWVREGEGGEIGEEGIVWSRGVEEGVRAKGALRVEGSMCGAIMCGSSALCLMTD